MRDSGELGWQACAETEAGPRRVRRLTGLCHRLMWKAIFTGLPARPFVLGVAISV